MLTLKELERRAKITILNYLNPSYMTDDNIGLIIYYICRAEQKFDPTKGMSLETYLHNCAKFGAMKVKQKSGEIKKKHLPTISLDMKIGCSNENRDLFLKDLITDKKYNNENDKIEAEHVLSTMILTETEKDCIERYYLKKESINDISMERMVSKQAVTDSIKRGIKKLRERHGTKD